MNTISVIIHSETIVFRLTKGTHACPEAMSVQEEEVWGSNKMMQAYTTGSISLIVYLLLACLKHEGLRFHLKSRYNNFLRIPLRFTVCNHQIRTRCPHDIRGTIRQHYGRHNTRTDESLGLRIGEVQVSVFLGCFAASLGA